MKSSKVEKIEKVEKSGNVNNGMKISICGSGKKPILTACVPENGSLVVDGIEIESGLVELLKGGKNIVIETGSVEDDGDDSDNGVPTDFLTDEEERKEDNAYAKMLCLMADNKNACITACIDEMERVNSAITEACEKIVEEFQNYNQRVDDYGLNDESPKLDLANSLHQFCLRCGLNYGLNYPNQKEEFERYIIDIENQNGNKVPLKFKLAMISMFSGITNLDEKVFELRMDILHNSLGE